MFWLTLAPLALLTAAAPAADKRFMVTSFDQIRVEGPFEVVVTTGSWSATASGDARALDPIRIRVEGSTLIISAGGSGWQLRAAEDPASVKITIAVPVLTGLTVRGGGRVKIAEMRGSRIDLGLSGTGSIEVGAIRADDLGVTLIGTGAITLAGTAARTRIRSYGDGAIAAEGLRADEAALMTQSTGKLDISVRYTASISAFGTGAVNVLGPAKCRVGGTGPVTCANIEKR